MKFYTGKFYQKKVLNSFSFHLDYTVLMTALSEDPLMFAYCCAHMCNFYDTRFFFHVFLSVPDEGV